MPSDHGALHEKVGGTKDAEAAASADIAMAMAPRISLNRDLQLELAFHLEVSTGVDAQQSQIGST